MEEVIIVNPKLELNARKYLRWRPDAVVMDMHQEIGSKRFGKMPLAELIASILRSPNWRDEHLAWVQRIVGDLGLKDTGSLARQVGIGWNGRRYDDLVESCEAGKLSEYMSMSWPPDYIASHFFFIVKSPFNLLNWDENPLSSRKGD